MSNESHMTSKEQAPLESELQDPRYVALRAGTWSLLGNLLVAQPADQVLAMLCEVQDGGGEDSLALAWAGLRDAARTARSERDAGSVALGHEYQDVFIGVGGGEVTPYASWYISGSMMDKSLVLLRQDLAQLGIERQEGVSEPEDHAAALCEIMALVISDPDVSFQWQRQFYQRHLDPWVARFFQDLQQAPSARFYRAMAGLGSEFIKLERQYFDMLA
jgi:TorA maturation chaperone TorD